MESYEERLKNYFERLSNNTEILIALANKNNQKTVEILLLPKNEKELELADATLTFIEDTIGIVENAMEGNLKSIDPETSVMVNLYADIIKSLKENGKVDEEVMKKYISKDSSINEVALFVYESLVAFTVNPERTLECIINKSGFEGVDDELAVLQFKLLLAKAAAMANELKENSTNSIKSANLYDMTDEKAVNDMIEFSREFHKLYVNGLEENHSLKLEPNE